MKRQILTLLLLIGLAVASCTTEKQNVITGKVDGLQVGDKIILLTEDIDGASWLPADSTIVEKENEFTIKTNITGDYVMLRYKNAEARIFLEGYANLQVVGNTDQWRYVKITGGIYGHPDLQEIIYIVDSGLVIQQKAIALMNESRESGDTAKMAEGSKLIRESNGIIMSSYPLESEFIIKYPDLTYSAGMLRYKHYEMETFEEYENAFAALTPEVQGSPAGLKIKRYIDNTKASSVGAEAPDFSLVGLDEQTVTLSDYRGKYVLLDFWGSWCGPCRQSSPKLVELYNKLKEKNANIEFIGIGCSEKGDEKWKEAIEKDGLTWIHINDVHSASGKSIQSAYAIDGVPTCVLVSPDGIIEYKEHPFDLIPTVKELFEIKD